MEKLEKVEAYKKEIKGGGGDKKIEIQHQKGKMTARERLNLLFDKDSFVEIGMFRKHHCSDFGMKKKEIPGDGVVTGYGRVHGRLVYAYAQDFTTLGGTLGEVQAEKICKVQDAALKNGAPIIGLMDSGGARIQEGVCALTGYGKIFYRNTISSGVIPQISAIMGPCAGGAVYSPGITDFIFMVEKTSNMFITGPDVIKVVTGETVTGETLGGASVHNKVSGVAHFHVFNDYECISKIRVLLGYMPDNNTESVPRRENGDAPDRIEPILDTIVPENPRKSYDMHRIIELLADKNTFFEVQKGFARNIIVGFGRFHGYTVGIIANQPSVAAGCLDVDSSDKAARFIRFCDAFNIPLLTLVDVPGFLPGKDQEYRGIIRHGAKMLYAYSEATVTKITVVVRKAYGGAYIGMCCCTLGADAVFAWPNVEIAVMGAEGAVDIMYKSELKNVHDAIGKRKEKIEEYREKFSGPFFSAEHGYIDDIIKPSETRLHIIRALEMGRGKQEKLPPKKHGNIPL